MQTDSKRSTLNNIRIRVQSTASMLFAKIRSSLITKFILVFDLFLVIVVVTMAALDYKRAVSPIENLTRASGEIIVDSFAKDQFSDIIGGKKVDLQMKLDNRVLADKQEWILDALVFDKDMKLLARKRPLEVILGKATDIPELTESQSKELAKRWSYIRGVTDLLVHEEGKSILTISAAAQFSEDTAPVGYVVFVFSQAPAENIKGGLFRQTLAILFVAILILPLFIALLTYRSLRPIVEVTHAFELMHKGDYSYPVKIPNGNDEVAKLAKTAVMAQAKQKKMEEILTELDMAAVEGRISKELRHVPATVIISDIVSSTSRSLLHPTQHIADMKDFYDLTDAWAKSFGATTAVYTGDGSIMAFGILEDPHNNKRDAEYSLMCVVGMQILLYEYAHIMKEYRARFPLICRIGISMGMLDVGLMGKTMNIAGPTIAYADRLQKELQKKGLPGEVASDWYGIVNASRELMPDETVPDNEVVLDQDIRRHNYVFADGPDFVELDGFENRDEDGLENRDEKKKLPIFFVKGLRYTESNEELAQRLIDFRKRPDIEEVFEKGLNPNQILAVRTLWQSRMQNRPLLMLKPKRHWLIQKKGKPKK